jgi:hypothetical protein
VLTRALASGAASTSAFIGLAELALEAGEVAAALDAAKRGIKFVFDRSRAGHERARHAALMLNLLAAQVGRRREGRSRKRRLCAPQAPARPTPPPHPLAFPRRPAAQPSPPPPPFPHPAAPQAMSRCGKLDDAHTVFSRLAARVAEGEVAFGCIGLPPISIRHEAIRCVRRGRRGKAGRWAVGRPGVLVASRRAAWLGVAKGALRRPITCFLFTPH